MSGKAAGAPAHTKNASSTSTPAAAAAAGGKESAPSSAGKSKKKDVPTPEALLLEEIAEVERGEDIAVASVGAIVKRALDKLSEHYVQEVSMQRTAKQAVDFVLQAIEWQLLVHDDGEKLPVRKILADKHTNPQPDEAEVTTEASSDDSSSSSISALIANFPTPDPITEPNNRARPPLDIIASKLSLPTTYNQIWTCEEEPMPVDLDKWARGVIPTKATHSSLTSLTTPRGMNATVGGGFTVVHEQDEGSSTPRSSTGSLTPSHSRAGHRRAGSNSSSFHSRDFSATNNNHAANAHRRGKSIMEEKESAASRAPQPFKLEVSVTKEALAKEKSREMELRHLEKKKKAERELAQVRAADNAERDRMERIQTELRHRNYTFDNRGNVILIQPVPTEKFPAFSAVPKIQVKDEYLTDEQEAEIAKREKRNRFKKANMSPTAGTTAAKQSEEKQQQTTGSSMPAIASPNSPSKSHDIGLQQKKAKKVKPDVSAFVDLNATQPSLMQTLTLAKGVTLKQGALTKSYDPRANKQDEVAVGAAVDNQSAELRGLTRKEYLKKLEARRIADAKFLPTSAGAANAQLAGLGPTSPPHSPSFSRPGSSPNNHSPRSSVDLGSTTGSIADYESENEWAAAAAAAGDEELGGPSQVPTHRRPTSSDAFNHLITHDPNWGMNPSSLGQAAVRVPRPPQPSKPQVGDRIVGARVKAPRERVQEAKAIVQPQHAPPPPVGRVTHSPPADYIDSPPLSPKPFEKIALPESVIATDKAKLYFRGVKPSKTIKETH